MVDQSYPMMGGISPSTSAPWVLVAGGFHYQGGMDKANAALAEYLLKRHTPVHLVTHCVDPEILRHSLVTAHIVPRLARSNFIGELFLGLRGRSVANYLTSMWPATRVVVNGGNCNWPDVNWVHYVHHAWSFSDQNAPLLVQLKNRATTFLAKRRERSAICAAHLALANSHLTRRDLIHYLNIKPGSVKTMYLGSDPNWDLPTPTERFAARAWLGIPHKRPLVVFVGALGRDERKGFDSLWLAWKTLCSLKDWDADLIIAGGGSGVAKWQFEIKRAGLSGRIRLLGFTDRIAELLAAADLLVSPVRYESYGLNVQEAICRGVPAMVSSSAGVAERYTPNQAEMLLPDPEDVDDLVLRLLRWRPLMDYWKEQFLPLARTLRSYSWADMAHDIVSLIEGSQKISAITASSASTT
jgi:glycosyltransferase involved in cell wall biosynthesis